MRKSATRKQRKRKTKPVVQTGKFWVAALLALGIAALAYAVLFSPFLQIEEVRVSGAEEVGEETIREFVRERLGFTWLGVKTGSNVLLLNARSMEQELLGTFPELSEVSLKRSFSRTLTVEAAERVQVGTWCRDSSCVAFDKKGVPFKEAGLEGSEGYPVFQGQEERQVEFGQEFLDPSLISLLLDFREAFQRAGTSLQVMIVGFDLGPGSQVAGIVREGWRILLDVEESMEWQETKLRLVLEQKVPPERREELEYIDLRFGDQAYIQYQE